MQKLSNFLADYIRKTTLFNKKYFVKVIHNAIEAYKEHLKMDTPRTAGWVMREKELITALDRMESGTHDVRDNCNGLSALPCGFEFCPHPHEFTYRGCDKCGYNRKEDTDHGKPE